MFACVHCKKLSAPTSYLVLEQTKNVCVYGYILWRHYHFLTAGGLTYLVNTILTLVFRHTIISVHSLLITFKLFCDDLFTRMRPAVEPKHHGRFCMHAILSAYVGVHLSTFQGFKFLWNNFSSKSTFWIFSLFSPSRLLPILSIDKPELLSFHFGAYTLRSCSGPVSQIQSDNRDVVKFSPASRISSYTTNVSRLCSFPPWEARSERRSCNPC